MALVFSGYICYINNLGCTTPTSKMIQKNHRGGRFKQAHLINLSPSAFAAKFHSKSWGLPIFHGSSSIFPRFPYTLRITRRKNEGVWMLDLQNTSDLRCHDS